MNIIDSPKILAIMLFLVIMIAIDFIKNKKILTPIVTFNFIWLITIFLYQMKLSTLQQDFNDRTLNIFLVCIFGYNLGVIFYYLVYKFFISQKKEIEKKDSSNKAVILLRKYFSIDVEKKFKIANIIIIIGIILEMIYSKGFPLIWKLVGNGKTYMDFGIPSFGGMINALIICLGAYCFLNKDKWKYTVLYLLIGILIISRQVILSLILEGIVFKLLDKKSKVKIWKYGLILLVCFVMFNIIGNFRSGSNVMNDVFMAKEEYKNLPNSMKWIYSYMTFSLSNFNNLVSLSNGGLHHGSYIINEFIPTILQNKFNIEKVDSTFYLVSIQYTVSTYLPEVYLDFGIIGEFVMNFIIGIFGTLIYLRYTKKSTIANRLAYSVFIHNIVFMFFINMFIYLPIIFQFFYIAILFIDINTKDEDSLPQEKVILDD